MDLFIIEIEEKYRPEIDISNQAVVLKESFVWKNDTNLRW